MLLPNRPLVSRLVLDAHLALRRPDLPEAAAAAGTGVLVDPLTPLFMWVPLYLFWELTVLVLRLTGR